MHIQSGLVTGNQKGRACGGEDGFLRRKFSLAFHRQCCPPPVSAPFLRASVLPAVSARSVPPCPSAVHRQCPFRFSVLSTVNCRSVSPCPAAPVLSTVSVCSVSPCLSVVHRQCRFSVPQCCPPSVPVPFLRILELRARVGSVVDAGENLLQFSK